MSTLGLGAIMPADLNHTLEVDVHAIGELEGLEVGETNDGRARTEVLDLLEPAEKEYSFIFVLRVFYIIFYLFHLLRINLLFFLFSTIIDQNWAQRREYI